MIESMKEEIGKRFLKGIAVSPTVPGDLRTISTQKEGLGTGCNL